MAAYDPNEEGFRLAIQLQMEDIDALHASQKGKNREGEPTDLEIAIASYKKELETSSVIAQDRKLCESIAGAVRLDGLAISAHVREEERARRDRKFAEDTSAGRPQPQDNSAEDPEETDEDMDTELLAKLAALYVSPYVEGPGNMGESSSWAASRKQPDETKLHQPDKRECVSCRERYVFTDVARCPCSHEYCRACLYELFQASLNDETLFPPKCCKQKIPLEENRIFLPSKLVGLFKAKEVEYNTPNRTYCHLPACSTFIPVQFIKDEVGTCVRCKAKTCIICKGESHANECPDDTVTQELLRMATENGWQRCFSCHRVVELELGCNHITCPCGTDFCYVCGQKWKTCGCEQWHEDRLVDRAQQIVNRDADPRVVDRGRIQELVAREQRNLIENHECEHRGWKSRSGGHHCEECHDYLPLFIYECRQCRIMACRRCRFNRL